MENLINFIKSERKELEDAIMKINEKLNTYKINIQQIESTIIELGKNVDTTYEIFSPNSYDKDYNVVEIDKLNLKKNEILLDVNEIVEEQSRLIKKKKQIDIAYDELEEINNKISNSESNTVYLIEKEKNLLFDKFNNETKELLEYQLAKQNHILEKDVKNHLNLIDNKINLCQNFINIDLDRAKLELLRLNEDVNLFNNKLSTEMFHVKHLDDNSRLGLNEEIKKFIAKYKKNVPIKIEYKYIGPAVSDNKINIINIIRILKESIDNACLHSFGNIVNINIAVVEMMEYKDDLNKDNLDTSTADLHQINFVVNDTKQFYNVSIKITDNGNGFELQDEDVLINNDMYGIYLMKYRTKLLKGKFLLQSEIGLGTTITISYNSY